MVFRSYNPGIKCVAVRMLVQGHSFDTIRITLVEQISRQSFNQWKALYEETRRVIRDPEEYEMQGRPDLLTQDDKDFMTELIAAEPGLFLDEIREQVYDHSGTLVSPEAIHYCLTKKLGMTLKKAEVYNIRKNLVRKYDFIEKMEPIPAEFLVFTDESLVCSRDLLRTHARSPKGTRALKYQNNSNAERYSLIPAISIYGMIALTVLDDCVDRQDFEHFLKWHLLPRMNRYPAVNSILVLDNARVHKGGRIPKLCSDAGIRVMYLPPYCPELNPIEMCFSVVKAHLRRTQALVDSFDEIEAIYRAAGQLVTQELCEQLYRHAGYSCTTEPYTSAVLDDE
ncbi:hypothetical protein MJO29_002386 [Puccinia striiformis f. sp. tritici]|nr:hypothetical protein MJO29_002386 [Puccinia striiformis f. sp. tritici]